MFGGHRHRPDASRPPLGVIVGVVAVVAFVFLTVAAVWAGTETQESIVKGTMKNDVLTGTAGKDRVLGYAGKDWLRGLAGDDVLDGGKGADIVSGGPGKDRISARDGFRDRIYCGFGKDRVVADRGDRIEPDCETRLLPIVPPPPPPEPESRTCSTTDYKEWIWEQCRPGTTIRVTNEGWHCSKPLAEYGPLPIKVISISTEAWSDGAAVTVNSGCSGSPGTDINLILDIRGEGPLSQNGSGADAFKTRANPEDLRITGSVQCGRRVSNAHQDAIQIQGGTNITFVNVKAGGNYDAGLSTCQGAGGGLFYSLNEITNVDVLGGKFIGCDKGLNGNNASPGTEVTDAKFRSGRTTDPSCTGFPATGPCLNTSLLTLQNVTCEQWLGGRWVAVSPR
jgi:hemolysin type calcium-binding protein